VTTSQPTRHQTPVQSGRQSTLTLVRRGALAGVAASIGTTALAALARAAGVSLEVDDVAIPIAAFTWWTLVGAVLGILMARLLRSRGRFLVVSLVATGMSLVPPVALPDDAATSLVLVAAHLVAAAIIIPSLSRELTTSPPGV
jgi:hypothetical protein